MPKAPPTAGPQHVVFIPDGNRRWARRKGLFAAKGHESGAQSGSKVMEKALELGIPYITFWGASISNITKRTPKEVALLHKIFIKFFRDLATSEQIHKNKVRIRVLGRWPELFPSKVQDAVRDALKATGSYSKFNLTILLAYSGIEEMTAAVESIAAAAGRDRKLKVSSETIASHLWSKDLPPVDLVIRTGGEPHWSEGLLMWHVANAQLHFTDTLWPDFAPKDLEKIIANYRKTQRRLGA